MKYNRNITELKKVASLFWPPELKARESSLSKIPVLLETQDEFISILNFKAKNLGAFFEVVQRASMPANLFVQHLMVLSDFGGEMLQRINKEFNDLFPDGTLDFIWEETDYEYEFTSLPVKNLTNARLKISGKKLFKPEKYNPLYQDVITLLLFGSFSKREETAEVLNKCEVGSFLGKRADLKEFIKQRYIWVSRITGGAKANSLGQIAQSFVIEHLSKKLDSRWGISVNGKLPGVYQEDGEDGETGKSLSTFDIVITNENLEKRVGIEVSFQVTTNSTIERKAGQSMNRFNQVNNKGYRVAYVIDGAGNFQRENAISRICQHSHCTVAFSQSEFDILIDFISKYFYE